MTPVLRAAQAADADFLRTVFAAGRDAEVAAFGWPPQRVAAFLAMQFEAQRRHFRTGWPQAIDWIVSLDGSPIGRFYVNRGPWAFTVLDIALLAAARGAGIGTALLRGLQAEAATTGVPIELRALPDSPALRLYRRLGFDGGRVDGQRVALRWEPLAVAS
ncbi:GNAT family N-acetyltransferase [Dactylosporangium matsuzakiense]|uniref:N-acetyltransferase domain-containing protein n=1 Tax=Dactylosporangium matsuzakiense TaxID=53360 RepID=A0A9W6KFJ3_9ACTN|nr:GNAT family N-acetyltransferase [Dactylosporangium matsuzakiense]UWZ42491.1 GNAT family N-acetyltransferase [Dactylosporangium matsuzakiense]GLL00593.1 hypothetical protein GCM10017581_023340 [Dactylosporangium matsuzakiense]